MANISDVARSAGVSPTTVSRYLNHRIDLPEPTAARIDAAIAELEYRPNLLAKRLSTGKSEAIGLVTPEIGNPFFAALAAAVEDEAERHGYAVFMSSTRGDMAREVASLRRLADRHVDGMILLTNRPDDGTLARLIGKTGNVVLLDEDIPKSNAPRIFVENEEGMYAATQHLIAHGHKAIAMIGGPEGLFSVNERRLGFERAMRDAGLSLQPGHMRLGAYTREYGRAAAHLLLEAADAPTAIVSASDFVAIGVMQAIRDRGLRVPEDLSLVGFDDMPFAELVAPPLTTVRQPIAAMGRLGFQTLLALMNNQPVKPFIRLPVELIQRQSVAAPRKGQLKS
jgi:LacI family transcriptional regulator